MIMYMYLYKYTHTYLQGQGLRAQRLQLKEAFDSGAKSLGVLGAFIGVFQKLPVIGTRGYTLHAL